MKESVSLGRRDASADEHLSDGDPPSPPPPPAQPKIWRFYRHQLVGVPLLLLVTVLAMAGVFGDTESTTTETRGDVEVRLVVADRFRFKMIGPLTVTVFNQGAEPIENTAVRISTDYLANFSNVSLSPAVTRITDEWHEISLGALAPGESAVVTGEIQAESFGLHRGLIEVQADDRVVELEAATWAFP